MRDRTIVYLDRPPNRYCTVRNDFVLHSIFIVLLIGIAPLLTSALDIQSRFLIYPLCVLMLLVTLWIALTIKKVSSDLFSFYCMFIFAALLFNGGQVFLELLHLNKDGLLNSRFDPKTLSMTLYLVILSLASFHMGGILSTIKKEQTPLLMAQNCFEINEKAMKWVGFSFLAISAFPAFIITMDALKIVMHSGYFALYQQHRPTGLSGGFEGMAHNLSHFFVPGLLFLFAGSKKTLMMRGVSLFALIAYAGVLYFFGRRGHATGILLAGLWAWHMIVRPVSLKYLVIVAILLLFFLFPTIQITRNIEGASRLSLLFFVNAFFSIENPILMTIREMGGSMATIAHTIELIPDVRPLAWGSTYGFAATGIIPNLFWQLHPAVEYGSLGNWLTSTVDPYLFYLGGGLGYSFIAEAYANFGWIGTPLAFVLIGFFSARLSNWPYGKQDHAKVAVVAVCIANMLFWVRGDLSSVFRPLFYSAIIPYVVIRIIRSELGRKNSNVGMQKRSLG
jgi:oligosaccharide repeat unit polymerase